MKRNIPCLAFVISFIIAGCSTKLIQAPLTVSGEWYDITLLALTLGPDQYNTADGYWEPKPGRRFAWATVRISNRLKTKQKFRLDRVLLLAGSGKLRPFIIDMGAPVSLRANPEPELAPGETISRKLMYTVPKGVKLDKVIYERAEMVIPVKKKQQ
jgi:hypothetical protein